MTVTKEQSETLKQKICAAFANVSYPTGLIAPHECDECRDVRKTFRNKDWRTIEPQILEKNYGIIPLFSPEAFHFFLPAYLIYSLDHFSDYDSTCEFTIYAVTPSKTGLKERGDYWQERFQDFTTEQMNCVYKFLDLVKKDENFALFLKEIDIGEQNLRKIYHTEMSKNL